MPFYQKLAAAASQSPRQVQLAVLSTDSVPTSLAYLRRHAVEIQTIAAVQAGTLKVSGTPTLLLIDRQGSVKRVWRGKLTPAAEAKVLETVFGNTNLTAESLK
jgi:hypothetical protein